jgi:shikimate kinase
MGRKWIGIALIGMPGSGKTTLGAYIAKVLDWEHIDLDKVVQEKSGLEIASIFDLYGEDYFRQLESDTLETILSNLNHPVVLSTGGGTPIFRGNLVKIHQAGFLSIFLECPISLLLERLANSNEIRPLLSGSLNSTNIETLYAQRVSTYQKAHHTVHSEENLDKVAHRIINAMES